MKRTSLVLTAALFAFSPLGPFANVAHATGSPFQSFFISLQGQWSGTGEVQSLAADGTTQDVKYEIQVEFERADQDNTWSATNHITTESGGTSQNNAAYTISGDLLLVGSYNGSEPVQVTEISSKGLTYLTNRTDALTGRNYTFSFHVELDAYGDTMTGHNMVQTNSVTIQDETFTAKKW